MGAGLYPAAVEEARAEYGKLRFEELNYGSYLKIPELLRLQELRSRPQHHDEMFFIVIHQSFELWFKEVLHELDLMGEHLAAGSVSRALKTVKRVNGILDCLGQQIQLLATLTPVEFAGFRSALGAGSGFQSLQFREIEFVLGFKRPAMARDGSPIPNPAPLARRLTEPTIMDGLYAMMATRGYPMPAELVGRDPAAATLPSEAFQAQVLEAYRAQPELAFLFEALLDVDEGIQEWRYRHVKLTERTIGAKQGTGGSTGLEFLKATLFRPLFPDLWAVRHRM